MLRVLHYTDTYFQDEVDQPYRPDSYPYGNKFTNVYGLSIRIGILKKYGKVIIDYYGGLGIQYKDITYHMKGTYDENDSKHHSYDPVKV